VIRAGCADRGSGSQGKHRMGLGNGSPSARSGLAVSLAEQPVRLSGKFLGAAGNALVRSLMLHVSRRRLGFGCDTTHVPVTSPMGAYPPPMISVWISAVPTDTLQHPKSASLRPALPD
jgi:hypothetical protein